MTLSREEFERLKEAEKEHLRAVRELRRQVRSAERTRSVQRALGRVVSGARETLSSYRESLEHLLRESAESEARLDAALDDADERDTTVLDEELTRIRARRLLDEMRTDEASRPTQEDTRETDDDLPDRTIGRLRR